MAVSDRCEPGLTVTIAAIFADWGTTNRRAWAVDRGGAVLGQRHDDQGLLGVKDGAFESSFHAFVGDWLADAAPTAPVLMGGMVGSKLGWRECPYLETPARFADLGARLTALPDLDSHPIRIAPGLSCRADGRPDVMRGEECQLYGLWLGDKSNQLAVLPGTHSKWATIAGGAVARFQTYMTGELFAQLGATGTIAQLMHPNAPHDEAAFRQGLEASADTSAGGLLHRLFSVRTYGLFGELPPWGLSSYLSGMLIGAELRDACTGLKPDRKIAVIGSSRMTELYVAAMEILGFPTEAVAGDTLFIAALHRIALDAGLI